MTQPPKPKPKNEDPEQSQRFLDLARELEAAGDLSPTDGGEAFDKLVRRAAPARTPTTRKKP